MRAKRIGVAGLATAVYLGTMVWWAVVAEPSFVVVLRDLSWRGSYNWIDAAFFLVAPLVLTVALGFAVAWAKRLP